MLVHVSNANIFIPETCEIVFLKRKSCRRGL